jgi:predicted aspartyl protease
METFSVPIKVGDISQERYVQVDALVDTRCTYAALPGSLLAGLGITPRESRKFEMTDGRIVEYPVSSASLILEGRKGTVPVVFNAEGVSPVIGMTTLGIFGLGVDPDREKLLPVPGRIGHRLRPLERGRGYSRD